MGIIHDLFSSRNGGKTVTIQTHVGNKGRIFYDETVGELRLSDGQTAGGLPIPITIATELVAGSMKPGPGLHVDGNGTLTVNTSSSFVIDPSNKFSLLPATESTIGGIKLGPGVTLNGLNQLIIDTEGLDFSFGDFFAFTGIGASGENAAYLSSINENQDIVIQSNGTGQIDIIGRLGVFPVNGPISEREPVFAVDDVGSVSATTLNIVNKMDLGVIAPLNVTINEDGLTKSPVVVTGTVAQFTGRDSRSALIVLDTYGLDTDRTVTGGEFVFRTARGTNETPLSVQSDDILGNITAAGWASNGYGGLGVGGLRIVANEDFTPTTRGSRLEFYVVSDGTLTPETVASVDSQGLEFTDGNGISHVSYVTFDTNSSSTAPVGSLNWNTQDKTLNLYHPNGVVQQIGQETFSYVINNTGSTIENGMCVRFNGAVQNGTARLAVAPFLANGEFPTLYGLGILTESIGPGNGGLVCVWGKVRELNTTGAQYGETWTVGDVLYASSTTPGGLTNVKPTAPNNVMPVAAVLAVDAVNGELFVRPTIEQKMSYGVFARTTSFTATAPNVANAITFDTTEVANGVGVGTPASRLIVDQSGLYQLDITAHFDATGGGTSAQYEVYLWIRKNGVDVPNSMRSTSVGVANPVGLSLSTQRSLTLNKDQYVEIMFATSNPLAILGAIPSTAFGPTTAALEVSVTQIQL